MNNFIDRNINMGRQGGNDYDGTMNGKRKIDYFLHSNLEEGCYGATEESCAFPRGLHTLKD